jgi:hypothetical protein
MGMGMGMTKYTQGLPVSHLIADVFVLSLSEVWPVDWHKRHLTVDQDAKLLTCTSQ